MSYMYSDTVKRATSLWPLSGLFKKFYSYLNQKSHHLRFQSQSRTIVVMGHQYCKSIGPQSIVGFHITLTTKIQTTKLSILLRFYVHDVLERLKTNFQVNFCFKKVQFFFKVLNPKTISKFCFLCMPELHKPTFCIWIRRLRSV